MDETTTTQAATPTESAPAVTTTIGDARASLAAADAASTATPQTPETTPVAATAQPEVPAIDASPEAKGEPPKWRWQDILANARETTAKETETRIRQEFDGLGDFTKLNAHERAGLVTWHRALSGDPQALTHIATVARSNPQVAQTLKGLIAAESPAPAADPMPEPDLIAGDGSLVYSSKQQNAKDDWLERRLTEKLSKQFEEKLQPLQQVAQTVQQRDAQATYTSTVTQVIGKMAQADPDFETHKPDIGAELQKDQSLMSMALTNPELAIELAWGRVYRSKVLPERLKQKDASVLADLQQRAVSGAVNPATAASTTPKSVLGNARAALEMATAQLGS